MVVCFVFLFGLRRPEQFLRDWVVCSVLGFMTIGEHLEIQLCCLFGRQFPYEPNVANTGPHQNLRNTRAENALIGDFTRRTFRSDFGMFCGFFDFLKLSANLRNTPQKVCIDFKHGPESPQISAKLPRNTRSTKLNKSARDISQGTAGYRLVCIRSASARPT